MFRLNLSSNSESEDENIQGHFKKVYYQGNFSDSEHQDSQMDDSPSEESKNQQPLQRKGTDHKSSDPLERSKIIKKNCESAKMSRQRKKVYLQLLEQKARQLKIQIYNRKNNIRTISAKILQKFSRSNKEKHKFLAQKLALSKRLLALSQEIQQLRKSSQDKYADGAINHENSHDVDIQKNISPDTLVSVNAGRHASPVGKTKNKKKKVEEQRKQVNKMEVEEKINEKQGNLQLGIKAYLYEFGVRGSLRTDVIERTKLQWFQNIQNTPNTSQTFKDSVKNMKNLMQSLQQKTKKVDYYLRELKSRVKQKFVVQFLLDRQFFIHNSADTIYKNTQLAPACKEQ